MSIRVEDLRETLVAFLGDELTPDVAASIELGVLARAQRADFSIHPDDFLAEVYGNVVFAVERFRDLVDELLPLHEAHWAETEAHRAGIAMNPDYAAVMEAERLGQLLQFTARDVETGALVGQVRMYVRKSLHTQTQAAHEDVFFVLPAYRKGMLAIRFWQYMERVMQQMGCREIRTDSKLVNRVNRLNEYLGYRAVSMRFVKVFDQEGGANVR